MLTLTPPLRARRPKPDQEPDYAPAVLDRACTEAGLTPRQRHVVIQRLNGRSFRAIALDAAVSKDDGSPVTHQRVKQIEGDALRKLKVRGYSVACLNEEDRAGRAAELHARGRLVRPVELHHDPEAVGPRKRHTTPAEDAAARMTALADQFISEARDAGPGGLSPDREAFYRDEAARIARAA